MQIKPRNLAGAAIGAVLLLWAASSEAQDAKAGRTLYEQCSVCHTASGANGVGPSLKGIAGRRAGTYAGFRYSRAMQAANLRWDEGNLDAFLRDPQGLVPGNVMPFAGIPDGRLRADLIAYLKTLK